MNGYKKDFQRQETAAKYWRKELGLPLVLRHKRKYKHNDYCEFDYFHLNILDGTLSEFQDDVPSILPYPRFPQYWHSPHARLHKPYIFTEFP